MLIKTTDIKPEPPSPPSTSSGGDALNGRTEPVSLIQENADTSVFIAEIDKSLTKAIGQLQNGKTTHFYSWGNFNLVRLIMYILKQTGPAHAFMTSYSFSQKSIEQLKNRMDKKELLSFRVIIDNRVKSMSPLPFQMLKSCFDYRCTSIHAKIALIWNEKWHITGQRKKMPEQPFAWQLKRN